VCWAETVILKRKKEEEEKGFYSNVDKTWGQQVSAPFLR
jgi:hypothetical protein